MPYFVTKVGRLFVESFGSGPAIVLWPSLLTDGGMWHAQAAALAEKHRVLVVDPPSHGRSDPLRRPFTLEDCAEAVLDVLDRERVASAIVAGLSWGGMVGLRLALAAPGRVRALALFDTTAEAEPPKTALRYRAMAECVRRFGVPRWLGERVVSLLFAPATLRDRRDLADELLRRLRGWDREGLYFAARAVVVDRTSVADRVGSIRAPTLVAVGERDVARPPAEAERLARAIPGARLAIVGGAGHLSALERPDEVTRLLEAFVDEVS